MKIYAILGYKLHNNIHPILKKRLDKFIKLYKNGDKVILCGGNSESNVMSNYIQTKLKILKKNIILEKKSTDTIENIKFLLKILNKKKFKKVYLITSSWHMKRVKYIVKCYNKKKIFIFQSSRILNPPNKDEKILIKEEKNKLKIISIKTT